MLARDCVASIRRWGARDGFGQALLAATEALSAPDDRTILFRLRKPFPMLPDALGKSSAIACVIMPERLALTDPFKQVTEMVGSGPYRYVADERVPGDRVVYARFEGYRPRESGDASRTAGGRSGRGSIGSEWRIIQDAATAGAALQRGEVDWWLAANPDLLERLRADRQLTVRTQDPTGIIGTMRFNQLQAPFDNPALRRAVLAGVRQQDYMQAVSGPGPGLVGRWRRLFLPGLAIGQRCRDGGDGGRPWPGAPGRRGIGV